MCALSRVRRSAVVSFVRSAAIVSLGIFAAVLPAPAEAQPARRPNILWLTCEDMSPQLGCFGDKLAHTPNLDRMAAEGVRYTLAFSTSGVCAPSSTLR